MKKAWALGGLVCLIAGPAMVQAADPAPPENRYSAVQAQRQAEREHIHQERQAIAATRKREETACYRRFAVEDCLRDVRTQARRAELQLRGRELQLNDAERKEKAAERLRSIEEKQRVAPDRSQPQGSARGEGRGAPVGVEDLRTQRQRDAQQRAEQQRRDQEQREQAERRRIERMSAAELAAEIQRLRPPRVLDLVERDRSVMQAEQERQTLEKRHAEAGSALARARGQAQAWREAHGIRAALHDKGLMQSSTLAELEQQGEAARIELLKLAPRIEDAALTVRSAREAAHLRINAEQAPALAKVDELERLRREKLRQEFEQQKRQQAEKKAEREREAVPKDFKLMAQKREMKASGWGDRGDQWQAAPDGLKKLIEGYNAAPKEARPAILDRILSDSSRREQVHGLIAEQRAQHRKNDRGISR